MASLVRMTLLPSAKCLYTQPVQVLVDGLRSRQVVTLKARAIDDKDVLFHASAVYRADTGGAVDLGRDPSLGGSYTGVEPMGLLRSLRADTLHAKFYKNDSRKPHVVRFSVHEGEAAAADGEPLAEATNERRLLADGVSRQPIKEGNIRGVLFVPPGGCLSYVFFFYIGFYILFIIYSMYLQFNDQYEVFDFSQNIDYNKSCVLIM